MTAPIPAAEVIAHRRYGGIPTVRALCPACGRTHLHRWRVDTVTAHTAPCGGIYIIGSHR